MKKRVEKETDKQTRNDVTQINRGREFVVTTGFEEFSSKINAFNKFL